MISRSTGEPIVFGSGSRIGDDSWITPRLECDPFTGEVLQFETGSGVFAPRKSAWHPGPDAAPDLEDPATAGVLVHLIDEWEFNPHFWTGNGAKADGSDACGVHLRDNRRFLGPTLGEAAARALLAIWVDAPTPIEDSSV